MQISKLRMVNMAKINTFFYIKSANVTESISEIKLAQCCPSTSIVHWHFKFSNLPPKLGPEMAHYRAESRYYSGKPCWKSKSQSPAQSKLLRHTMLEVEKPVWPSNGTLLGRKLALFWQTRLEVKKSE